MIDVKVFGSEPPCAKCKQAEQAANEAAGKYPAQVTVQKLAALSPEGFKLGIMSTPTVVINGRVVVQGRAPSASEFEALYQAELEA